MAVQDYTGLSAAEYFELPETTQPTELIDGEVLMSPSPVPQHQTLVFRAGKLIDDLKPNGDVFIAPLDVYLDERSVPQPDVMWVAEGSRCAIGERRLEGPPDLIVEVFSPGTVRRDKTAKFRLYQRHGVREYWMIDPFEQYVEVYALIEGKFALVGVYEPEEAFTSPVLGQSVDLKRIFDA